MVFDEWLLSFLMKSIWPLGLTCLLGYVNNVPKRVF